jgi:hypothetical protein
MAGRDAPGGGSGGRVPLGQRLYDSPFLLLVLGLLVMLVFYTGWGLVEILTLKPAPLP